MTMGKKRDGTAQLAFPGVSGVLEKKKESRDGHNDRMNELSQHPQRGCNETIN